MVLLESVLPLAVATIAAAVTGFGAAIPGQQHPDAVPAMPTTSSSRAGSTTSRWGAGLLVSLAVILATLPLLNRITRPHNVRFE